MITDYLLERAYAHDPLVMAWCSWICYRGDGDRKIRKGSNWKKSRSTNHNIMRMREEMAEKEEHLTPLTGLELILEGARKKQKWAEEKIKEKGFATIEELEAKVDRLRWIVGDPQE